MVIFLHKFQLQILINKLSFEIIGYGKLSKCYTYPNIKSFLRDKSLYNLIPNIRGTLGVEDAPGYNHCLLTITSRFIPSWIFLTDIIFFQSLIAFINELNNFHVKEICNKDSILQILCHRFYNIDSIAIIKFSTA